MENDYDPECNPLTAALASGSSHGTLEFQPDGTFVYTPDAGFVGIDSFTYTISNGSNTAEATAYIDVYNSPPSAANDEYDFLHDRVLSGWSVLDNDYDNDGDALTAALVSGPSSGTLEFHADGTFTYTPDPGFVGTDSFVYEVGDGIDVKQATASLYVTNSAPQFADIDWLSTEDLLLAAGSAIVQNGMVIGQLQAFDYDGDLLTFSGASSYFSVDPVTGHVTVIDGEGLTAYFSASSAQSITVPVSVTDGIAVVYSEFVLSSACGWIDQSEIYVKESNGSEFTPTTADELIAVLESIRARGNQVETLIIKGHRSSQGIEVGDNGEYLTTAGDNIYVGNTRATDLLNDVTGAGTTISLRGCFTYDLAQRVRVCLDGAEVYGAIAFVIGIPGTTWGIGVYPPP